jgi:tRNA pseudouridine32 synthase
VVPHKSITVTASLLWDHRSNRGFAVDPSATAETLPVASGTPGQDSAEAKDAETVFESLRVDEKSKTSLVRCWPKTGRTHQLRIHLAHLGFPIANDRLYGGKRGPKRPNYDLRQKGTEIVAATSDMRPEGTGNLGGAQSSGHEACDDLGEPPSKTARIDDDCRTSIKPDDGCQNTACNACDKHTSEAVHTSGGSAVGEQEVVVDGGCSEPGKNSFCGDVDGASNTEAMARVQVPENLVDKLCAHCPQMCPRSYPLDLEPLWLHAERYECPDWTFEAPLPAWASEAFDPGPLDVEG